MALDSKFKKQVQDARIRALVGAPSVKRAARPQAATKAQDDAEPHEMTADEKKEAVEVLRKLSKDTDRDIRDLARALLLQMGIDISKEEQAVAAARATHAQRVADANRISSAMNRGDGYSNMVATQLDALRGAGK